MLLTYIIGIYIAAAVIPAIFLLVYIYNHDTVEKEPAPLLIKLFFMGALATLISMVLEEIGDILFHRAIRSMYCSWHFWWLALWKRAANFS